uniref:CSON008361 protein n=1 Tax=Culicoides sonorensis TaxID=179676 RepID=A0A336LYV0_CULSO
MAATILSRTRSGFDAFCESKTLRITGMIFDGSSSSKRSVNAVFTSFGLYDSLDALSGYIGQQLEFRDMAK